MSVEMTCSVSKKVAQSEDLEEKFPRSSLCANRAMIALGAMLWQSIERRVMRSNLTD